MTASTVKTHDYRNSTRGDGWDLSYEPLAGNRLRARGWGLGLKPGDYLLLSNGDSDTRYRVADDLRYCADPLDMWFATLDFAPR